MSDIYFMGNPAYPSRGRITMVCKGRLSWAFCERCEDGFTLLSKPSVLVVRLLNPSGVMQKLRVLRFRKQENLNTWVSQHLQGLREDGYDVSYVD